MFKNPKHIAIVFITGGLVAAVLCFWLGVDRTEANLTNEDFVSTEEILENNLVVVQGNSLVPVNNKMVVKKVSVIVTAYSSSPEETDSSPFITASGSLVKGGIVANNLLPFGTEIRLPELYPDEIFVVEDRMSWKKGYYHIDIWFPSKEEAKEFGAKRTYIEVLEG